MKRILLELQYFRGCPNSPEMIRRVKEAIRGMGENVFYKEVLVETNKTAEELKFRGSPTLLINSKDFEGRDEPERIALSCRYYPNGLPTTEVIRKRIIETAKDREM